MNEPSRRRPADRTVALDRSLEGLPLFRLGDSGEESSLTYQPGGGGRWRVLPAPGDRLPGTFDQDVYVELVRRLAESPDSAEGVVSFTLHSFLRSMGRKVDGRTYELLRVSLARLERTTLESQGAYYSTSDGGLVDARFSLLAALSIERRRRGERDQLALFDSLDAAEPGEARVTIAPLVRRNVAAGHTVSISLSTWALLGSPVARRLYRLLSLVRSDGRESWELHLERLAELLPLAQRYPSHLQRVLEPAHQALLGAGVLGGASIVREDGRWLARYHLASASMAAARAP